MDKMAVRILLGWLVGWLTSACAH